MNTKNETSGNGHKMPGNTTESHEKRSEAAHKGAETRSHQSKSSDNSSSMSSHEKHVEAGRKGGEARAEHMREQSSDKSGSSHAK